MSVKIAALFPFISLLVISLICCSGAGGNEGRGVRDVGYIEAAGMINAERPPIIFDVRTPGEFNGEFGHLPGARLMPMQVVGDSLDVFRHLAGHDILLVCRSGRRSGIVANELAEAGIKDVYNLEGGMRSWKENGGRIERDFGK